MLHIDVTMCTYSIDSISDFVLSVSFCLAELYVYGRRCWNLFRTSVVCGMARSFSSRVEWFFLHCISQPVTTHGGRHSKWNHRWCGLGELCCVETHAIRYFSPSPGRIVCWGYGERLFVITGERTGQCKYIRNFGHCRSGLNASEKGRQGNHVTVGDAIYNKNCVVVVGHGETSNGKLAPPGGHGRFMWAHTTRGMLEVVENVSRDTDRKIGRTKGGDGNKKLWSFRLLRFGCVLFWDFTIRSCLKEREGISRCSEGNGYCESELTRVLTVDKDRES